MLPEIHLTKTADGVRFRFPRRRVPQVRLVGAISAAFGILLILFALTYFPEKLSMTRGGAGAAVLWTAMAVLVAIALIPLFNGLWMAIGHDEIEFGAETLRVFRCVRRLRWPRSRSTDRLQQFTLVCLRSTRSATHVLYAEFHDGPPLLLAAWYPRHWLAAVAGDLAKRCSQTSGERSLAQPIAIVERELDGLKIAAWNRPYATAAVYGGIFMFVGAIAFFAAFPSWRDRASRQWPSTEGQVITSEVAIAERKKRDNDFHQTKFYRPNIIYRYRVADQELTGSRRYFGVDAEESEKPQSAERAVADYPTGKSVRVYYDPQAPPESVLEPGGGAVGNTVLCLIGGLLLLVGTPFVAVYFYRAHSSRSHFLDQHEFIYDPARPGRVADYVIGGFATRNVLGFVFVGLLSFAVMGALLAAVVLSGN